jgi:D-alanyl-lipoteichoic acid acyltransferase DltB (MBOAT superfamily)
VKTLINQMFGRMPVLATAVAGSAEAPAIEFGMEHFAPAPTRDPRELRATPRLGPFLVLAGQLALLLLVFSLYHLEKHGFLRMSAIVFGAFLVHYWLPFRIKEPFWVAVSMAGAFVLLQPLVAALLIVVGLAFFLILRSPVAFRYRVSLLVAIFGVLIYGCATKSFHVIPGSFYAVFGAIFMFRIIIYVYDLAHARQPAQLLPFLSYFFLLPNYYFTLFPVVDFQTMRRGYYQRDIHEIAQQGIYWMMRGAIQLMLYRLVTYFNDPYLPDRVTSLRALITTMVLTFLLYLNVSGTFHLIVGMLHLFGYDLPETNRRYLLSSSFTDFWRRANIYWKDFMVKIVYFPVYFKLHKRGDVRAQVVATAAVFLVTWGLHSYQFFWVKGQFLTSWPDTIFWTILGLLVIANVLYERHHKRRKQSPSWQGRLMHAVQVLVTFTVIVTLWSLWSSPTVGAWGYLMTHWMQGR